MWRNKSTSQVINLLGEKHLLLKLPLLHQFLKIQLNFAKGFQNPEEALLLGIKLKSYSFFTPLSLLLTLIE